MQKSIQGLILSFLLLPIISLGQLSVNNTSMTVEQYVQNVLLGGGVSISNVQFNGGAANINNHQVGSFNDPNNNIGLSSGLILGSGNVQMAAQQNTGTASFLGGTGNPGTDADLQSITLNQIYDECVIEFDFVPDGDTISFNYVFASEEYPEFVCGTVNDAFGFFLTGTNPNGGTYNAQNIALIPDPSNSNIYTTTPVSINTVNPGFAGISGMASNCSSIDPNWASYNVFYQNNTSNSYEYDGSTTVLVAKAHVVCGETYHIKLAIGDGGDEIVDSGVFLEEGSFSSSPINAGSDDLICSLNYSLSPNPSIGTGVWSGTGTFSPSANDPNAVVTVTNPGTYTFTWTENSGNGCINSDDVNVVFSNISHSSNVVHSSCGNADGQITLMANNGIPAYQYSIDGGLTFQNSGQFTGLLAGNYNIIMIDSIGCQDSSIITVTSQGGPVINSITTIDDLCINSCEGSIAINATGASLFSIDNGFTFQTGNTFADLCTGTYDIVVQDNFACSVTLSVFVGIHPPPYVNAGNDLFISFGEEVILQGNTNANSFAWYSSGYMSCISCLNPTVSPSQTTSYILSVTDTNGCQNSDTVSIFINGVLYVPNTFTPNNDGINDVFEINGTEINKFELWIFNRWGELLYNTKNMNSFWDGTYKGNLVQMDTYIWKIKYEDYHKNFGNISGHLNVLK